MKDDGLTAQSESVLMKDDGLTAQTELVLRLAAPMNSERLPYDTFSGIHQQEHPQLLQSTSLLYTAGSHPQKTLSPVGELL